MNTVEKVGKILDKHDEERDAIHVCVCPVTVGEELMPGARVRPSGVEQEVIQDDGNWVGIIDPFLAAAPLPKGTRVYLFMKPGSVGGMRHVWGHADLEDFGGWGKYAEEDHEAWCNDIGGSCSEDGTR